MGDGSGVKREALLKAEADDVVRTKTFDVLQVSGVTVCVCVIVCVPVYMCEWRDCTCVCECMCDCIYV